MKLLVGAYGHLCFLTTSCCHGNFGLLHCLAPSLLLAAIFGGQAAKLLEPIVIVRFLLIIIIIPFLSSAIKVYGSP